MAVIWKINGDTPATLGVENLVLRLANQAADIFTFKQVTPFDGTALFAAGAEIVLTRQVDAGDPVTWFRGYIRRLPRRSNSADEQIIYEARGGWELLERRAFLQNFKEPVDAEDPESSLTSVMRGRVVLGQDDTGAKVALSAAVTAAVNAAISAGADLDVGTVSIGSVEVPWDEATDLSCADVIARLLQWKPDAVVWFDYTVDPPEFNCVQRSALTAVDLEVKAAGSADTGGTHAPLESVLINPRHDLVCEDVCLIYLRTNRSNEATWETTERDVYPPGTTGLEDNALVRTIQLAGSVYNSTMLEQRNKTEVIPSIVRTGFGSPITSGGDFTALSNWWSRHDPVLASSNVTIKSFLSGDIERLAPSSPDTTPSTQPTYELLEGSVTDWMKNFQGVEVEQQTMRAEVILEVEDPLDSTKVERITRSLAVTVTAISTDRTLHTFLQDDSYTEPEAAPEGLAEAIHGALSVLQYDGTVVLVESEATGLVSVGHVLNLTDALAAWETMKALVQQAEIEIDSGRTTLVVGPAKHLGPDDLIELFRVNRNRQPVTSHLVRTGGTRAPADTKQGLGVWQPSKNSVALPNLPRVFSADIT
ncbi:MAG: hypothetical protein C0518_05605 [Opitutus sp.]|nr:hypothetical protein [Opitutus sp.]